MLRSVNKLFYESTPPEHFATLFFAHYDDRERRLRYANCGHPSPILLRADGSVERLSATATVLGVFSQWTSEEKIVDLKTGDTLVIFSDGITEAGIESDTEFGEDGLLSVMRSNRAVTAETLVNQIVAAVAGEKQDDVTVVAVRVN
jgi:sigma-B regulation protein RsbU (phosphoserine phosphatase)